MFGGKNRKTAATTSEETLPESSGIAHQKAEPQCVTPAELDTLVSAFAAALAQVARAVDAVPGSCNARLGYRLGLVVGNPGEFGLSADEAAVFKKLAKSIDEASGADYERERRRASQPNDSWRRRAPQI
jgi:hypothetical protein